MLVDSALNNNFDLTTIWYQFRAAEAVVKRESSFLWPDIEAGAQSALNRPEPDFAGGENLQLGLSAAYEIDLWGRIRSGIQAEKYRARASLADYQTGAISLSAEIAITWYQLVATENQLALVEQQITTNENIIRLIRARFGTGQISAVDILRQMQLLEATQDQKILLETNQSLLENQLAVLLGKQPQAAFDLQIDSLPSLPPLPESGLPLELVRRRPDIQQAYNLLLAADRDMATAVTSQYPRLSVTFRVQQRSNDFSSLFQDWAYTIAGNLVAPLLYGGRLSAEVDRTEAVKYQRLYEYGQTVLTAFREVEDAMVQEVKFLERMDLLNRRLELATKTNAQLRISFLNGLSNYLDVLVSLDQEQQLRRDLIAARFALVENRIALYRALAGSFETEIEANQ
jgi:NodT family efflux transporter outer membrane factor (OMF) lipoprotein